MKQERRKKKKKGLSLGPMRLFFTIFIILELLIINAAATLIIGALAHYFPFLNRLSSAVWLVIVSSILGSAITTLMVKFFFDPLLRLGQALQQVADGDFDVTLKTNHMFREIRRINESFNRMTKELSSTEILKTEFISNVSHEFKTPINAIEGYATLLQDADSSDPEEQTEYIHKILFNTHRLSKLVGNILLLSKVDNQGIQTRPVTYRLDEQIRQSLLALEPRWIERDTEFDVDLENVEYTGNENLLMHVWNNLMENAIKYGPRGGLITMRLTKDADMVTFTIDDEGPGIPEEAQSHIFDRFYQADSSRKSEGNGLGLALVKQILTISDGTIAVENLPEKGTRFTVRLHI